jgi:preprotein translocase subunit SecG
MFYGFLLTLFVLLCLFLIVIILVQKGKGSTGLGSLGGGTQMLFGGSGGQDLFQKVTWVLGAIFMASSLLLVILGSSSSRIAAPQRAPMPMEQAPVQQAPQPTQAPVEPAQ